MRRSRGTRLGRSGTLALFAAVGVFVACSSSQNSAPLGSNGPTSIEIALPTMNLACDGSLVVQVTVTNWYLLPPGRCGILSQCGSLRVTLLDSKAGKVLAEQRAATSSVQLDLSALLTPSTPEAPSLSQGDQIQVELLDDALKPFVASPGAQSSQHLDVSLLPAADCSGQGGANAGGAAGTSPTGAAGAAGATASEGGASGGPGAGGAAGAP